MKQPRQPRGFRWIAVGQALLWAAIGGALAWLLTRPAVTAHIIGPRTVSPRRQAAISRCTSAWPAVGIRSEHRVHGHQVGDLGHLS